MNPEITRAVRNSFSWRLWLRGLIGAVIGAAGNGITLMIIDPAQFNIFTGADWRALLNFCTVSALISAGLYIKSHPIVVEE